MCKRHNSEEGGYLYVHGGRYEAGDELGGEFSGVVSERRIEEAELRKLIDKANQTPPAIHPGMAERYRQEVGRLFVTLNDKQHRTGASSLSRDLLDRIVFAPNAERSDLMMNLHGDLAGILSIATGGMQKSRPGRTAKLEIGCILTP